MIADFPSGDLGPASHKLIHWFVRLRNTQEDRHSCLSRDDVYSDRQECLSSVLHMLF
jgi:hypothetical protein